MQHGNMVEQVFDGPMPKVTEIQITSEATGLRPENSRQRSQSASHSPYTIIAESSATPQRLLTTSTDSNGRPRSPQSEVNVSARAYFKYAILYFVALLVTFVSPLTHIYIFRKMWILIDSGQMAVRQVPSTINRVYIIVRPEANNFGLELATCFVLPLQGFWNSIVYIAISWPSMKTLFRRGRTRDKNSYPLLLLGISLVEHEPRATCI